MRSSDRGKLRARFPLQRVAQSGEFGGAKCLMVEKVPRATFEHETIMLQDPARGVECGFDEQQIKTVDALLS